MARTRWPRRIELGVGWAETPDDHDLVEIGDHLVPRTIDVVFAGADGQPRLEMTVDSSSGVPRCTDLHLASTAGGREVRTTDLRLVKIEDWLESIVPLFMHKPTRDSSGGLSYVVRVADSDSSYVKQAKATLREGRRGDRRRVTPEVLRRVAKVYGQDELRPAEAVQRAFGVSTRTAYRYIRLAREGGYFAELGT